MDIKKFAKTFNMRHTFNSDDFNVLKASFPDTKFSNIPDAWIILIDTMMLQLGKIGCKINSVSQYYGQLVVDTGDTGREAKKIINKFEKKLYDIDKDLHLEFTR